MVWVALRLFVLASVLPVILAAGAAEATSLHINPVQIVLSPREPIAPLRIRNLGQHEVILQLEVHTWRQEGGKDRLEPTDEAVITPPIFRLEPGHEQLLRIGLITPPTDSAREHSYRILLRDVSPRDQNVPGRLQMRLQVLLPVFLAPETDREPDVAFRVVRHPGGALSLSGRNSGNVHIKIVDVSLIGPRGAPLSTTKLSKYILPGQASVLPLDAPPGESAELEAQIRYTTVYEPGSLTQQIPVVDERVAQRPR